jgi:hypothetical protein
MARTNVVVRMRAALCAFILVALALALSISAREAAAEGTLSFTDNFDPSASPLWNDYAGNWTAPDNCEYYASVPNNSPPTFTGLPFKLTDYTISVTVNSLGDGGIWVRSDGTNQDGLILVTGGHGYGQGVRGGDAGNSLYWQSYQNGTYGPEMNVVNFLFTPGKTYVIKVVVKGDTYSAFVNGSSTATTTLVDDTFPSGEVGLYDDQPNTTTGSGFGPPQSFSHFALTGTPEALVCP